MLRRLLARIRRRPDLPDIVMPPAVPAVPSIPQVKEPPDDAQRRHDLRNETNCRRLHLELMRREAESKRQRLARFLTGAQIENEQRHPHPQ